MKIAPDGSLSAPFTTADGMGFCSAACEAEAQAEFAAWSDEQDADEKPKKRDMFGNVIQESQAESRGVASVTASRPTLHNERVGGDDEQEPTTQFDELRPGEASAMPIEQSR